MKKRGYTFGNFTLDDEGAKSHGLRGGTVGKRKKEIRRVRASLSLFLACMLKLITIPAAIPFRQGYRPQPGIFRL